MSTGSTESPDNKESLGNPDNPEKTDPPEKIGNPESTESQGNLGRTDNPESTENQEVTTTDPEARTRGVITRGVITRLEMEIEEASKEATEAVSSSSRTPPEGLRRKWSSTTMTSPPSDPENKNVIYH